MGDPIDRDLLYGRRPANKDDSRFGGAGGVLRLGGGVRDLRLGGAGGR
jgi:hypothetical protein